MPALAPVPGNKEGTAGEMIICSRAEEDLSSCSTRDSNREDRKSHETQSQGPTKSGETRPQEASVQGIEYTIPREGPDSQEAGIKGRAEKPAGRGGKPWRKAG